MLYIHHVPGRLRLQTPQLRGNRLMAEAALDDASVIPGVSNARVNVFTGSLIITYNEQRLTPAELWESLCERGIVSGALPIQEGVAVTRARIASPVTDRDNSLAKLVFGIIVERLLERSAVALVGSLI